MDRDLRDLSVARIRLTFFLTQVLAFGWPMGFLSIAVVDLACGLVEGVLLYKAYRLEPTA